MIDLTPLDNSLRVSILSKAHKQQAEGGDHRDHPEIRRGKQPGQDNGRNHLNGKDDTLGEYRNPALRTERRRSSPSASEGRKLPLASKGFKIPSNIDSFVGETWRSCLKLLAVSVPQPI